MVRGRGEGPIAPREAPDGAVVGDPHLVATGLLRLVVPPLSTRSARRCGALAQAYDAEAPLQQTGSGPEGCQQRGHMSGQRALALVEAGGPPERGRGAIPPVEGLVECGPGYCQAMGDLLQRRQPPLGVRPRNCLLEEAPHEDVLQAEVAGGQPPEGV